MNLREISTIYLIFALLLNAYLFIPQAYKIWKNKTANNVSIITFIGFLLTQLPLVIHGFYVHDLILAFGYLLSMITCSLVVLMIFIYRKSSSLSAQDILNQLPGNIYWKDRSGRYLGCNRSSWEMLGFSHENDIIGKTDYDIFPEEQAAKFEQNDQNIIRDGEAYIFEEFNNTHHGTVVAYLSHKSPLKLPSGEIIGVVGSSIDMSALKEKQNKRLEFLENIIALMPGHVYWIDTEGVYQGCNTIQAHSAGLSSHKDIVGKRNSDLPWNTNRTLSKQLDQLNQEIMRSGVAQTVEEPGKLQDGTELMFLSSKVPLKNDKQEVVGLLGISIDITELKHAYKMLAIAKEKAEVASKTKTEFLANISHDIRTPLSGMIGMIEILYEQVSDDSVRQNLKLIKEAAQQLLHLLNQILDMSTLEHEPTELHEEVMSIHAVIDDVVSLIKPRVSHEKIHLQAQVDNNLPEFVRGDKSKLLRILLNILGNAVKFTQRGRVMLSVSLQQERDTDYEIRFSVSDTGIGIPQDKLNAIFDRFTKLHASYKGQFKGAGLGLSISKRFAEAMGGSITVDSQVNHGSVFTVILPFKKTSI